MPRTLITAQPVGSAGLDPVYEAANVDGNSFRLSSGTALHVKNGSAGVVNVTIPTPMTVDGLAVAERSIAVPAGDDRMVALGSTKAYVQPGGVAHVNYDVVASVTVAVLTVP